QSPRTRSRFEKQRAVFCNAACNSALMTSAGERQVDRLILVRVIALPLLAQGRKPVLCKSVENLREPIEHEPQDFVAVDRAAARRFEIRRRLIDGFSHGL